MASWDRTMEMMDCPVVIEDTDSIHPSHGPRGVAGSANGVAQRAFVDCKRHCSSDGFAGRLWRGAEQVCPLNTNGQK